jgi:hypothetical protein
MDEFIWFWLIKIATGLLHRSGEGGNILFAWK